MGKIILQLNSIQLLRKGKLLTFFFLLQKHLFCVIVSDLLSLLVYVTELNHCRYIPNKEKQRRKIGTLGSRGDTKKHV